MTNPIKKRMHPLVRSLRELLAKMPKIKPLNQGLVPFVWLVTLVLVVIFGALYINISTNNRTILRTELMKGTEEIASAINLNLTSVGVNLKRFSDKLDQDNPLLFREEMRNYLSSHPEISRISLVKADRTPVLVFDSPLLVGSINTHIENIEALPEPAYQALTNAFQRQELTISGYWESPNDPSAPVVALVFPFYEKEQQLAFLARISLRALLNASVSPSLLNNFQFSLVRGKEVIVGNAAFNPVDDDTIPTYITNVTPFPGTIQLFGAMQVERPLLTASPLLFSIGCLMMILLGALFLFTRQFKAQAKETEALLKEISLRRSVEASMAVGILLLDMQNRIKYTNDFLENLTGYDRAELTDKTPPFPFWGSNAILASQIFNPNDPKEGFPYRFDLDISRKDNVAMSVAVVANPHYDDNGKQIGWLYLMRDNTCEVHSHKLSMDSLTSFQKILDSVKTMVSVVTYRPSGALLGTRNRSYQEKLSFDVSGHLRLSKALNAAFDTNGQRQGEVSFPEEQQWYWVQENRLTLPGGNTVTLQLASDITQRKMNEIALEAQANSLEKSSRLIMLGEMASMVTHEINQPLTAIDTYATTAIGIIDSQDDLNKAMIRQAFEKISSQARRTDSIIKHIRSFARRKLAEVKVVSPRRLVEDTMELAKLEEKRRGVKVHVDISEQLPLVLCDEIQIVQLLLNLIKNAAEALDESHWPVKDIWVSAQTENDTVRFFVADKGPGLTETTRKSLFVPFYTTKSSGLGLGLNICRTIAEAHKSELSFDSNEDYTTIFSFALLSENSPRKHELEKEEAKTRA